MTQRVRQREARQAQQDAARQTIARDQALHQALAVLDPQPQDAHLEYAELLYRLAVAVREEQERLGF